MKMMKHQQPGDNGSSASVVGSDNEEKCATCEESECTEQGRCRSKVATKWISCDTCSKWYHGTCQGLQPADVTSISKLADKGVSWKCVDCRTNGSKSTSEGRQAQQLDPKANQQIDNIEKMVKEIVEQSSKMSEIEKKWTDVLMQNQDSIDKNKKVAAEAKSLMEKSHQVREEESRKNNAIVTGLTEIDGKTAMDQINDLMKMECFTRSNTPIQAFRLGKKIESGEQKRPIKVRFEDEQTKWEFIKRFNNQTLREKGFYCKLDESKVVRNQQFQLRQEVKRLRSESTSTQYRVRNMEIQEKERSGEWRVKKQVQKKTETEF